MTDAEARKILKEEYMDTPTGYRIRMTGWVEEDTLWERTETGWKKLDVRTSTDQ